MKHLCNCAECTKRRNDAERLKRIKAELPTPEFDWQDLEFQSDRARVSPDWYKKQHSA